MDEGHLGSRYTYLLVRVYPDLLHKACNCCMSNNIFFVSLVTRLDHHLVLVTCAGVGKDEDARDHGSDALTVKN